MTSARPHSDTPHFAAWPHRAGGAAGLRRVPADLGRRTGHHVRRRHGRARLAEHVRLQPVSLSLADVALRAVGICSSSMAIACSVPTVGHDRDRAWWSSCSLTDRALGMQRLGGGHACCWSSSKACSAACACSLNARATCHASRLRRPAVLRLLRRDGGRHLATVREQADANSPRPPPASCNAGAASRRRSRYLQLAVGAHLRHLPSMARRAMFRVRGVLSLDLAAALAVHIVLLAVRRLSSASHDGRSSLVRRCALGR